MRCTRFCHRLRLHSLVDNVNVIFLTDGMLGCRFDGGYAPTIKSNLSALIESLQPNAAVFQGFGVSNNPTRWIGTEAGTAPYPNWSSNNGNAPGGGSPAGSDFVPGEVDTTLQNSDQWSVVSSWTWYQH